MTTTLLRAPWIIGFQDGEHRILRDGCVVVDGTDIVFVGQNFSGTPDITRDYPHGMIAPGLISLHSHMHTGPTDKGAREDSGNVQFGPTGLIEFIPPLIDSLDEQGRAASVSYSIADHLLGGCTTVMDMGDNSDVVVTLAQEVGLRCYVSHYFKEGMFGTDDGLTVRYTWDYDQGARDFARAVELVERLQRNRDGLVRGFLAPLHVDTSRREILQRCKAEAERLGCLVQIHAAEAPFEVEAILGRHGRTSIEWLDEIGFLDKRTIVGHAVFTSESSWINHGGSDLALLARTGASVAYNPWCYLRQGVFLESFPRYQQAGINMCLGTDAVPQSMVESMRFAALSGKVMERRPDAMTARAAFNAATINAASYLERPDLGRLAAGAKADLVVWRTDTIRMVPMNDPVRNLVYYAGASEVRDVLVDGRWVVENGLPQGIDMDTVLPAVEDAAARMRGRYQQHDWAHRSFADVYTPTFAPFVP